MNDLQLALAHASKIALLALLAGIVVRGRARLCWIMPVYVLATLTGNTLSTVWPDRFLTQSFWMVKQAVYDVLKFAIGLELAYRAFRAFPGTWRTARLVLTSVIAVSSVTIILVTRGAEYHRLADWQPSISTGAVWLLTATALIVVWYGIPIHDWQRAIMIGFAAYLLVFVTGLNLQERTGWSFSWWGNTDSTAFLALISVWAWFAWRRDEAQALALDEAA